MYDVLLENSLSKQNKQNIIAVQNLLNVFMLTFHCQKPQICTVK